MQKSKLKVSQIGVSARSVHNYKIFWPFSNLYIQQFFPFQQFVSWTNSFLYKIKLQDTHLCTCCKANAETIEHLFFDCPITYRLWKFISNRFKLYFVNFVLNKENIFLGCKDESLMLNLLIILTKNYIYKCKLNEAKPNTIELKTRLRSINLLIVDSLSISHTHIYSLHSVCYNLYIFKYLLIL
jgi:hypothetical protein